VCRKKKGPLVPSFSRVFSLERVLSQELKSDKGSFGFIHVSELVLISGKLGDKVF
jgi:hypothetical protein